MLIHSVFRIIHDTSELCCICYKFIKPRQVAARAASKIAHYKCAKRNHWQRKSRAKKVGRKQRPQVQSKVIKVVRKGIVVKTVKPAT